MNFIEQIKGKKIIDAEFARPYNDEMLVVYSITLEDGLKINFTTSDQVSIGDVFVEISKPNLQENVTN